MLWNQHIDSVCTHTCTFSQLKHELRDTAMSVNDTLVVPCIGRFAHVCTRKHHTPAYVDTYADWSCLLRLVRCGGVANIGLKRGKKLRQGFACKQGIWLEAKLTCDSKHSHVECKNRTQNHQRARIRTSHSRTQGCRTAKNALT